jgi:uncharacterized protein with HEPN domain
MSRTKALRTADYLQHIRDAIDQIVSYTAGMDLAAFSADRKTQDAVIRNLEIVGEACNNIARHHPAFEAEHPEVPWRVAYEMRNALAHGYFTVDVGLVWQTVKADLPVLREQVVRLLK